MLRNYFKIGWRNLTKQKMYSAIKIGGFAVGVAACLLITLFIVDELSFDKHYRNQAEMFRLVGVITDNGVEKRGVALAAPAAGVIKADFAEVLEAGRFNNSELFGAGGNEIRPSDVVENTFEEGFVYFDQALVNMFAFEFVYGNPTKALSQPNALVITKRKADKYFPNQNPVGKTMVLNNRTETPYVIGGVIEDFKSTSHIQFDFLIGTEGLEFWKGEQTDWGASNYATYILVSPGTDVPALEKKLTKGLLENYIVPAMAKGGTPIETIKKMFAEKGAHVELQPIADIHLYSDTTDDGLVHGDIRMVWLFGGIAGFILLIAIINFVNLSTAKSANRAKEVGLRKVVGSVRADLVNQFLSESVLFSLISFVLGALLAAAATPYFSVIAGKSISFPWTDWWLLPSLGILAVVAGVMAGIYPSLYLSAFRPIQVLKGNLIRGAKSSPVRNTLVVFQFATSIVLIIGTIVIYQQMNYILHTRVGYDKEQVLLIQGTNTLGDQIVAFADELRAIPQVVQVTSGEYLPVRGSKRNGNNFTNEGRQGIDANVSSQFWRIDPFYLQTLGIKLVEGRDFNRDLVSDSASIIINQRMAKELGGNMVGKRITNYAGTWTVVGVVEDFHFESMREGIAPLGLAIGFGASTLAVKLNTDDMSESLRSLTAVWDKFAPHQPIRFSFLDERYKAMYADVQRMGTLFTSFAVLAIVVACLGLFALSAFMVEQRGKEIGIRLVLGASINSVFQLLTWNFVKLVLIAFLIAAPLGWYLMNQWLQDYAYKIEMSWGIFIVSGAAALLIAVLTISYQSLKAALMNPVNSLRSE